ncbi:MAG: hypothetical protein ACLGXA_20360 [Acidobacteriota bacterium]
MHSSTPQVNENGSRQCWRGALRSVAVALGLMTVATALAFAQQDIPPGANLRPWEPPDAIRIPDKNDQMKMQEDQQQRKETNFAAANEERKREIAADTAKLVELSNELKAEVDKTDKDTLSLDVIRKAEAIEKLAKSVRQKMKMTAGSS